MFRVIHSETDQSVVRVPIDQRGRPVLLSGAASVTFYDKREDEADEVVGTATVTQDATSAVLTAAAGYGQADPAMVPIAPSLVSEGHLYLIEGGSGQSELFRVRESSTTAVYAMHGLRHAYPSTEVVTVRGVELVATFPDITADEDAVENGGGPYLVTWSYQVDGSAVIVADTAYLDRYSLSPPIDEDYVLMANPTIHERSRDRTRVSQAIAVVWQDYVSECEEANKDPAHFFPSSSLKVGLRHGALAYLFEWNGGTEDDSEKAEDHRQKYAAKIRNLLTGEPPKGTAQIDRDSNVAVKPKTGFEFIRRS